MLATLVVVACGRREEANPKAVASTSPDFEASPATWEYGSHLVVGSNDPMSSDYERRSELSFDFAIDEIAVECKNVPAGTIVTLGDSTATTQTTSDWKRSELLHFAIGAKGADVPIDSPKLSLSLLVTVTFAHHKPVQTKLPDLIGDAAVT